MSGPSFLTRRSLLLGLAGAIGLRALPGLADETPPSDRGIGGTGITGLPGAGDAIGFVGSIQRFGSIYVNGDRIAYGDGVAVTIDGVARRPRDLLIGQVVKTVAAPRDGRLWTDRIDVTSEVVGPIEQLDGEMMTVLGQRVALGTTGTRDFALGQRVAVSGIRRADDTIVARLVEPAGGRGDQVAGTARFRGWTLSIGGLRLFGPDARFDRRRVVVRGRRTARGLMVRSIGLDRLPDGEGVVALSIEAYVSRHGNEVQLGSGLTLDDAEATIRPPYGDQPSFVSIDLSGRAALDSLRSGATGGSFPGGGTWDAQRLRSLQGSRSGSLSPDAPQPTWPGGDGGPRSWRRGGSGGGP